MCNRHYVLFIMALLLSSTTLASSSISNPKLRPTQLFKGLPYKKQHPTPEKLTTSTQRTAKTTSTKRILVKKEKTRSQPKVVATTRPNVHRKKKRLTKPAFKAASSLHPNRLENWILDEKQNQWRLRTSQWRKN